MTRKEVYLFIKSGVERLKTQHSFGRGRLSEFSSKLNKDFPYVWLETAPMTSDLNLNNLSIDSWPIRLHIAKLDREDSTHEQYEEIIDDCDEVAQSLVFIFNSVVSGYKLATISDISREPFIKKIADSATGVLLTFTLKIPDTTDQSENCD